MKKLLFVPLFTALAAMTSCSLDVDGNNAEVTTHHVGTLNKCVFTDSTNKIYEPYIKDVLKKDSIVGVFFTHTAKVDVPSIELAVSVCDEQAFYDYRTLVSRKLKTLDEFKRAIFSASYKDDTTFQKIIEGKNNYDELDLKEFKLDLRLYNYNSLKAIGDTTSFVYIIK